MLGLLAAIVAVSVRSWAARVVGSVGVLALSSVWVVSMWDQQVLTESLALSGLAAAWPRPSGSPTGRRRGAPRSWSWPAPRG
ncbi:MAG: hypothetical protein R2701_06270 [Acidimicrobiales bacterium]